MTTFDGISAVDVTVACTDAVHRARFIHGRLELADHDADAERAMAALGGDIPACVELLQLWHAAVATVADGQMNSIHALRRVRDLPADEPPWERPNVPFSGPPRPGVLRSLMNTRLPAALEDVLAQAAVLDCERRWDDPAFPVGGKRLGLRLLTEKVEAAVTESLKQTQSNRSPVRVTLACHVVTEESVSADVEANRGQVRLDLDLRLGWLVRVWRAGLATAGSLVVLDVLDPLTADGLSVLALEWRQDGHHLVPALRRVVLERHDDTWLPSTAPVHHPAGDDPWWSVRTGPVR